MIEAIPAAATTAAMSAWRRRLRGTHVRLEAVRSPAAAVISVFVVEEYVEPSAEDATDGVDEESFELAEGVDEEWPELTEGVDEESFEPVEGVDEESFELAEGVDEEWPELTEGVDEESFEPVEGVDEELLEPTEDEFEAATWGPAPIAGRYRIGEYLATSRLGRTYRAWDTETDQDVEVTFLDDDAVADTTGVEEWLEELRALRHLHVLPLLDWEIAPVPYLVYAAPAMRLDRLISSGAALSPSQTLLIGLQAAETLHNLRQRGITHGAFTPSHCCVDASGRFRLAELGVDFLRAPLEPTEATRYDAPEAIRVADFESPEASQIADVGSPEAIAAGAEDPVNPEGFEDAETADVPGVAGSETDDGTDDAAGGSDLLTGAGESEEGDADSGDVAADHDAAELPAGADPSPPQDEPAAPDLAAADVYGLGLALAEAAAGRPVAPAEISQLGRAVVPLGAGTATARHLARLAPLLVQATAARPENRLEADELALALRATAEMLPPPARLDEAFRRVGDDRVEPGAGAGAAAVLKPLQGRWRSPLMRVVAAAAVVAAGALLVLYTGGGDGTPSHTVPDVVGMDWTRASDTLSASGWEVRRLEVRVADAAANEVVGQLPEAGGLLDEGQVVKVQVSLGQPLVVIPADIVGLPLEQAGLRLSEVGLALGTVESRVDPSVPEGSVVAVAEMLPELPRGSQVDLVIAVGG